MTEQELQPGGAPEPAPVESEAPEGVQIAEADAAEVQETDEQKNERAIREHEERAEKRSRGFQKRIDEVTRDKYAERARAERAEREAEELRQRLAQGIGQKPQQSEDAEPDRNAFDSYEAYMRALARYDARQEARAERAAAEREAAQRRSQEQAQREQREVADAIQRSAEQFRGKVKDFDDVMESLDFEAPPALAQAIATSDNPAAILYALGKNPDVARRIATLHPVAQAKAIGAVELALKSASSQVSKAPPPGTPAGAKGAASNMPPEEPEAYYRWAEKNLKR